MYHSRERKKLEDQKRFLRDVCKEFDRQERMNNIKCITGVQPT